VNGRGVAVRAVLVRRMTRGLRIAREVGIPKRDYVIAATASWVVVLAMWIVTMWLVLR
jgi:hypothetical protein